MNKKIIMLLISMSIFSGAIFAMTEDDKKIIEAAKKGDLEEIKNLWATAGLDFTDKLDAKDNEGKTALWWAADEKDKPEQNKNYSEIVKFLLKEVGSDPNIADSKLGQTPLMRAAQIGDVESLKLLLVDSKTKINKQNIAGKTALDLATTTVKKDILKKTGAKTKAELAGPEPSKDLTKDLLEAAQKSDIERVKEILNRADKDPSITIDYNSKDDEGNTPFLVAVRKADYFPLNNELTEKLTNIVQLLLEKSGPNVTNLEGFSPLFYAIKNNNLKVVNFLIEDSRTNINLKYQNQYPLDYARKIEKEIEEREALSKYKPEAQKIVKALEGKGAKSEADEPSTLQELNEALINFTGALQDLVKKLS